jgi:hypothetical protein
VIKYIKVAFWNRWNILALLAGTGIAVLSGHPDIVGALFLAGEVAYLGMLGTHPKFQDYVDAQAHKAKHTKAGESKQDLLRRLTNSLPRGLRDRYDRLRQRCLDLHEIANNLRRTSGDRFTGSLDSMQMEGLDRLLWIFLRLLYTQHTLSQFLDKTSESKIESEMERIENRLAQIDENATSKHAMKLKHTLGDNLETCLQRLENYEKARANHEFVDLEIDRLENKIKSLAELAVNRREHDFISTQVDEVADSMVETEKTITELDFATGFNEADGQVPELLRQPLQSLDEA